MFMEYVVPNLTKIYDEFSAEDIILEILRSRQHLETASISSQEAIQWTTLEFFRFIKVHNELSACKQSFHFIKPPWVPNHATPPLCISQRVTEKE
ncbi:hypothetical protein Zmor_026471 [Zophobas morio]|uniref:Uncharacterized protein n=1 Tax=Zophobas morio TaxID=2755281 RepID=A0AA38HTW3_9CUCU|nr:hypothetical protein Zmor_026471 [Zophobas morio]